MLVNRVSLISFSAIPKPKGTGKKAVEEMMERISRGDLTESERKFSKGLEEARKKGELRPDGKEEMPPGMPQSD